MQLSIACNYRKFLKHAFIKTPTIFFVLDRTVVASSGVKLYCTVGVVSEITCDCCREKLYNLSWP